jgi:type VI secretion system protein ImpF
MSGAQTAFVTASVIERLCDARPDQERDHPLQAADTVAGLRAAVKRDVEALLNARRPWRSIPDRYPLLRTSPLGFGVMDFTAGSYNDAQQQEVLRAEIEMAVRQFEPRLMDVQVRVVRDPAPLSATLALRIEALLMIEPMPEPVSFDTVVDVTTADVQLHQPRKP